MNLNTIKELALVYSPSVLTITTNIEISINGKLLGQPVTLQVEVKKLSGNTADSVLRLDKIKDYFTEEEVEIVSLYLIDTLNMDIFSVLNPFNKRFLTFTVVL